MVSLNKIWQDETPMGNKSIRLDWSNDRHHEVVIPLQGNTEGVHQALLALARMISNDPHLKD